jgi:hypothetical protein
MVTRDHKNIVVVKKKAHLKRLLTSALWFFLAVLLAFAGHSPHINKRGKSQLSPNAHSQIARFLGLG